MQNQFPQNRLPPSDSQADLNDRLHLAISSGDTAAVQAALAQGADPNSERGAEGECAGCSALDFAAYRGNVELCRLLLESGADLHLPDHLPLGAAAGQGHEVLCRFLLQQGAEVNGKVGPGFTPLMAAAELGQAAVVRLLLAAGADPNTTFDFWAGALSAGVLARPPEVPQGGLVLSGLMVAASEGYAEICRLFVEHGVAVNYPGVFGLTPLAVAAFRGQRDACQALLDKGGDPNVRDADGDTPLILAATNGHTELCRLLLDHGADIVAVNRRGRDALSKAKENPDHNKWDLDLLALLIGRHPDFPVFEDTAASPSFASSASTGQDARLGAGAWSSQETQSSQETRPGGSVPGFCSRCTGAVPKGAAFCPTCGLAAASASRSPSSSLVGGLSHVDYSRVFLPFEASGGNWVPTFNWLAFFLGPLWYLLKGMWLKAIVFGLASFFLIGMTSGLGIVVPWLYYGFFGNWDLYLWERRGKQGW